jgi:hypothetical protein
MKRFLLWSFERGSFQYDVICVVILTFIFLTPPAAFDDRPDFMRLRGNQVIRRTSDDDGHLVFTVKAENGVQQAVDRVKSMIDGPFRVSRTEPVYSTTGVIVAYSIWVER